MSMHPSRRSVRAGWVLAALTLATGGVLTASANAATPPAFAARASLAPALYYIGDSSGSVYTFTVKNTGASTSIGAVQLDRPSTGWTITSCPTAPAGWVATASSSRCRYRSATTKSDDIKPGVSKTFAVKARTASGTADRYGTWRVYVSSVNSFDKTTTVKSATAMSTGLGVRLRTFQLSTVVVSTTSPAVGGACPAASKSAPFGSTRTIVVCGRNRATVALTPSATYSALGGSLIGTKGTFAAAKIPAKSATVVLAKWKSTKITSTAGLNRTVSVRLGSASTRTSGSRTFTGYTAYNGLPVAVADTVDATEDTPLTIPAATLLANDTDPDGDALKIATPSDPARGTVTVNPDGSLTYTPDANFSGVDSFTYVVKDPYRTSLPATVTVNVAPVADAPTATADTATTTEGATVDVDPLANDLDADGDPLSLVSVAAPGIVGKVTVNGGVVTYDPNAAFEHLTAGQTATESFTYTITDGALTATGNVTVTITGDNDAPVAVNDAYNTVAGAVLEIPAPGVLGNDTDVDSAITVTDVGTPAHGTVQIAPDGALQYTTDPAFTGVVTFSYAATDGTNKTPATVAITIVPPNAKPVANATEAMMLEDGSAITVNLSGTDGDGEQLTFDVGTATNGLVTVPASISCSNAKPSSCATTVTYKPNANFAGADSFQYVVNDGIESSAPATVNVIVTNVNDAPSFTKGANQTVLEDAGIQNVPTWASAIAAGPANEAEQTLTFAVTTSNDALFSTLPTVSSNGTLSYTPAPNAFGAATVSVKLADSGGTANGGVDQSATQTFTITVTGVNDTPSFTKGANVTVAEDPGAQSITGWATGISAGPANESGQTVSFTTSNNNNALFSVQPGVTPTGTLVYTPAANKYGTATVTVTLADNGGTENGGDATSDSQAFTITVTPVNDAPVAAAKAYSVHTNMKISLGGLLTGATDPNDSVGDPSWAPTFTVGSITPGAGCVGCTVSNINNAAGTFDFEPPAGGTGTYTISYTVVDNGHPSPGATSAPQTITFTVSGPVIWFADAAAGNDLNNGTMARPFATLGKAASVSAANHRIFLPAGTYGGGAATLPAGGWLTGAGAKAASFDALMGITPPAGTLARPAVNGTAPTVSAPVTLGSNNTLRGVQLTGSPALSGTSFGLLTLGSGASADVGVASPAQALNLNTGTITGDFTGVSSSGGVNNVFLGGVATTTSTSLGSGSLTGATAEGLRIAGGTGTFTYGGPVSNAASNPVAISGKTGGTVTLNGLVSDSAGPGVSLLNNAGATVNLLGGVTLSSGTSPAFVATGGGTVAVTGAANTLSTTTGIPLQVVNTTIGAADLTFRSISANGAANGIVLSNTGAVGNLAVTGTGTTASGGALANTTGPAISLTNTRDVALSSVDVPNAAGDGITGSGVTNLTLTNVRITGAGDADEERAVDLANLGGTFGITGGLYDDAADDLVKVLNTNTNVTLNVSGATFSNQTQVNAGNAFDLVPNGTSAITATINSNTFTNLRNTSLNVGAAALSSSGASTVSFTNNTVNGGAQGGAGVALSGQENTTTTFTVSGNGFTGAGGNGVVNVDTNDDSVVLATVQNNTFTAPKGHGIVGAVDENADIRMRVTGNTITDAGGDGIELVNFGDDSVNAWTSTAHWIVTNNTINGHSKNAATQFVGGIGVFHFEGDADTSCAAVTGNTVSGTPAGFFDIFLQDNMGGKMLFEENPNTASTGTVSAAYIQSKNPNTAVTKIDNIGAVYSNGTTCTLP